MLYASFLLTTPLTEILTDLNHAYCTDMHALYCMLLLTKLWCNSRLQCPMHGSHENCKRYLSLVQLLHRCLTAWPNCFLSGTNCAWCALFFLLLPSSQPPSFYSPPWPFSFRISTTPSLSSPLPVAGSFSPSLHT